MNEKQLRKLVKRGASTRQIAFAMAASQTNVRYWLKKYGIKTKISRKGPREQCLICDKQMDPKRDRYNAKCWSCYVKIRRVRIRRAAFIYKGASCNHCGRSDGPLDAYDFHYISGSKDFAISRAHSKSLVRVKEELDKCELLCAFCHRVVHSPESETRLMEAVAESLITF